MPVWDVNRPAGQSVHSESPPPLDQRPVAHNLHVETDVAPTSADHFPATQFLHNAIPATSLYLPAVGWKRRSGRAEVCAEKES